MLRTNMTGVHYSLCDDRSCLQRIDRYLTVYKLMLLLLLFLFFFLERVCTRYARLPSVVCMHAHYLMF